ncbi:MAG: hypothetical protein KDB73_11505 [Planctomycetes bacterium]|nr:hypothetical protein [Planctomycetota bacterium]
MIRESESPAPERQGWEPWEARRAALPSGLPVEIREARSDARLVLYVARARFREGKPPWDLADRLAAVAQDERVTVRTRRVAAQLLAKLRALALARDALGRGGTDAAPRP